MNDILNEIVAHKRAELILQKQAVSPEHLCTQVKDLPSRPSHRSMKQSLKTSSTGIIAEFKRRSPSKGWFNQDARADQIPPAYERAGAAALSILTDEKYFGGSLGDIRTARPLVSLPILRKDFIIDPYQVYEAAAWGADCILLIVAALEDSRMAELEACASGLGLDVLIEIHNAEELERALSLETPLLGINNRDLKTFRTSIDNTIRLLPGLPQGKLVVTESGILGCDDVLKMRAAGVNAFLVGEAFMRAEEPGEELAKLCKKEFGHPPVQVFHLGAAVSSNTGPDAIAIVYLGVVAVEQEDAAFCSQILSRLDGMQLDEELSPGLKEFKDMLREVAGE